jgi:hypothetical protein
LALAEIEPGDTVAPVDQVDSDLRAVPILGVVGEDLDLRRFATERSASDGEDSDVEPAHEMQTLETVLVEQHDVALIL